MEKALLDSESHSKLIDLLGTRHGRYFRSESLSLSARMQDGSVVVRMTLERHDRTLLYWMEAAKAVPEDESLTQDETLDLCMDFLDWYLGEYFASERSILLPLDWKVHRFGDHELLARGDVRNPVLDDAADAWLRGERPEV